MSRINKFVDLLTPPPFRRHSPPPKPVQPVHNVTPRTTEKELSAILKRLVYAPAEDTAVIKQAVAELNAVAASDGMYHTAFTLKERLDTSISSQHASCHKARGYVLVGDYILAHMRRELADFAQNPERLGPNIFQTYCNELLGCLLEGEKPQRAFEIPVLLIEELLASAVNSPTHRVRYLEFAQRATISLQDSARICFPLGETAMISRPGDSSSPDESAPELPTLTEDVFYLVQELHQFVGQLLELAKNCAESQLDESRTIMKFYEAAQACRYLPFQAAVMERQAAWVERTDAERAKKHYAMAAKGWRIHAEREEKAGLIKLVEHHLRLSARAQERAGSDNSPGTPKADTASA